MGITVSCRLLERLREDGIELSVSHGPAEFVKIKDIATCTAIYALTAVGVLPDP